MMTVAQTDATIQFDDSVLGTLTPIKLYQSGIYDEAGDLVSLEGALYVVSLITGSVTPVTPENLPYVWPPQEALAPYADRLDQVLQHIQAWDDTHQAGQLAFWGCMA